LLNLKNVCIMKEMTFEQMESINGGLSGCDFGCGLLGLAAGVASGFDILVGGLTTMGCFYVSGCNG
jgi:hypothetical protein